MKKYIPIHSRIYSPINPASFAMYEYLKRNSNKKYIALTGSKALKIQIRRFRKTLDWDVLVERKPARTEKIAKEIANYITKETRQKYSVKKGQSKGVFIIYKEKTNEQFADIVSTYTIAATPTGYAGTPDKKMPSTKIIDGIRVVDKKRLLENKQAMIKAGYSSEKAKRDIKIAEEKSKFKVYMHPIRIPPMNFDFRMHHQIRPTKKLKKRHEKK